ncbi:MAG: sulfotransferase [Solirubrobacterales bacterium]
MPVPTFYVIGASKAGTTSLHHYLAGHPGIAMTDPKEPHVLCGPPDFRDRLFVYAQILDGGAPIRGEVSPGYALYPFDPEVPDRIREIAPDARLVYLVRDPVERAIAHYAEHVIQRWEERPVAEALDPADPGSRYVAGSRYATQVEAYLRRFAAEQLLVIDSVELRDRRRETLRRIFAHVGADPDHWDPTFEVEHYSRADDNTRRTRGEVSIGRSALYRRALRPLLPERLRREIRLRARRAFGAQVTPEVDSALRARLADALAPEAGRLRELTGERFPTWSV